MGLESWIVTGIRARLAMSQDIVADNTLSGPAQDDKYADVVLCRFQEVQGGELYNEAVSHREIVKLSWRLSDRLCCGVFHDVLSSVA